MVSVHVVIIAAAVVVVIATVVVATTTTVDLFIYFYVFPLKSDMQEIDMYLV